MTKLVTEKKLIKWLGKKEIQLSQHDAKQIMGVLEKYNNGKKMDAVTESVQNYFDDYRNYDLDSLRAVLELADGSALFADIKSYTTSARWDLLWGRDVSGPIKRVFHSEEFVLGSDSYLDNEEYVDMDAVDLINHVRKFNLSEFTKLGELIQEHGGLVK
ncbi:hypothetical protein EQG49_11815 [Periweissella cryptocerci]|uniref:Uncharacterized protein n=1 Tax=Periweissella cryptocerci TaxID=2506420 RepID=A0A4P6YWC6_9LACO|nr:hypothetical protein [Periweissella cryptocerci]QBO37091.1 hypothetical protein EQG49_11815 [Periweissella cryptocerci]